MNGCANPGENRGFWFHWLMVIFFNYSIFTQTASWSRTCCPYGFDARLEHDDFLRSCHSTILLSLSVSSCFFLKEKMWQDQPGVLSHGRQSLGWLILKIHDGQLLNIMLNIMIAEEYGNDFGVRNAIGSKAKSWSEWLTLNLENLFWECKYMYGGD